MPTNLELITEGCLYVKEMAMGISLFQQPSIRCGHAQRGVRLIEFKVRN